MFRRNFLPILMVVFFAAMIYAVLQVPRSVPAQVVVVPDVATEGVAFTGRMVMPAVEDIYVLENTSGRNLDQLEKFLQGRAAGLHYLSSAYFRQNKKSDDISMGIRMTLDSLGHFSVKEYMFASPDNEDFKNLVKAHIEHYWRYPRATEGSLDFWIPVRWKAKY